MRHHAITTDRDWLSKFYRVQRLAAGCLLALLLAACGGGGGNSITQNVALASKVKIDLRNAFNEIARAQVLSRFDENEELRDLVPMMWAKRSMI